MRIDKLSKIFDKVAIKISHAEQVVFRHRIKKSGFQREDLLKTMAETINRIDHLSADLMGAKDSSFNYDSKSPKHVPINLKESGTFGVEGFSSDSASFMFAHQLIVKASQMMENNNPKRVITPDNSIIEITEGQAEQREAIMNNLEEIKKILICG